MSEHVGYNVAALLSEGVCIETSPAGRSLRVSKLGFQTAVLLGHALTLSLDEASGCSMYTPESFTLEATVAQAQGRVDNSETTIFGETRPADRNLAVRIEREGQTFSLIADVRNAYEDRPELQGGHLLQIGFVAAIGRVGFSA